MTEHSKPEPLKSVPPRSGTPAAEPSQDNVIDLFAAKDRLQAQIAGEQIATPPTGPTDAASFFALRAKHPLPLLTPPTDARRFRLRVELDYSTPPIWRVLSLPSDIRLDRLHEVIQVAVGWDDSHLHQFTTAGDPLGYETEGILTPFALAEGDDGVMESALRLDQLIAASGDRLHYTYDFGDGWDHTLTLEAVDPAGPQTSDTAPTDAAVRCLDGARKGPPEDVGGMTSYDHLLDVVGNREHPEYQAMLPTIRYLNLDNFADEVDLAAINRGLVRVGLADAGLAWLGYHRRDVDALFDQMGPESRRFLAGYLGAATAPDPAPVDAAVGETATAVIRTYLTYLGEGITLTAAGYLSPKQVATLMHQLDPDQIWVARPRREVDTAPLLSLREAVTTLGLARKYKGALVPTKLGRTLRDSPAKLWNAIVAKVPLEVGEPARDIGLMLLILVAAGAATNSPSVRADLDKLSSMLGWDFHSGGRYGNSAALSDVTNTAMVLTWAGSGTFLSRPGQPDGLSRPGAVLLAGAALRS